MTPEDAPAPSEAPEISGEDLLAAYTEVAKMEILFEHDRESQGR